MADEPEDMTLRLLREIRDKQDRFEVEQERFASLLGKVAEAVTAVATTQEHQFRGLSAPFRIARKALRDPAEQRQPVERHLMAALLSSRSTPGS